MTDILRDPQWKPIERGVGVPMTLTAYVLFCTAEVVRPDDGHAELATATHVSDRYVCPSDVFRARRGTIPFWATHVVWDVRL